MEILLKIVNMPDENIVSKTFQFDESGGTLGRNASCSWVLSDSQQVISNVHAKIEYKGSSYYLTDLSTNGVCCNQKESRLSRNEMIELKDLDMLYMGNYEILVTFIKANTRDVDQFSVSRFLEPSEQNDFLRNEPLEEEIVSPTSDFLEDDLFGEDPFGDEGFLNDDILVKDIIPPITVNEVKREKIVEENDKEIVIEVNKSESESLLLSLFSGKLGIDIESMEKKEQIRVINELAESLLIVLEEMEGLKLNINRINKKLEIDTRENQQTPLNIFSILSHTGEKQQFSKYLRENFLDIKSHQTALYESVKDLDEFLAKKFSPKSIMNEFTDLGKLNSWSPKQKDAQIWKEYSLKYSYLNERNNGESSLVKRFIIEKYRSVIEMFRLVK